LKSGFGAGGAHTWTRVIFIFGMAARARGARAAPAAALQPIDPRNDLLFMEVFMEAGSFSLL
jgi:hypothetical protein